MATIVCEGGWGWGCRSLGVRYAKGDSIVWLERNERHAGRPEKRFGGAFSIALSHAQVWFRKHGMIGTIGWYRYDLASGVLSDWSDDNAWNTVHEKIASGEATWFVQPGR